jgi:hypothetical protein
VVQEGDLTAVSGQVTVPLTGLKGTTAYHIVVTPAKARSAATAGRYEAEYAKLGGTAKVTYGANTGYSGTSYVEGYGESTNASTEFVVTVASDGYYNLSLRYSAGPYTGAPADRWLLLRLNGSDLTTVALPGTANWNTWKTATTKVYLQAGINRVAYNAYTRRNAVNLDYLEVAATSGSVTAYEAEAGGNTLSGTAVVVGDSAASGGSYVGWLGAGAANTLRFNGVTVPAAGRYRMVVSYANGELGAGASNYNSNIVDRYAEIRVNSGTVQKVFFRNTLGWSNYWTTVVDVTLNAGANTITFGNSSAGYAPNIDRIQIAAPLG